MGTCIFYLLRLILFVFLGGRWRGTELGIVLIVVFRIRRGWADFSNCLFVFLRLSCLLFLLALFPFLPVLRVGKKDAVFVQLILLFDIKFIVLERSVFAEVPHVNINLSLTLPHIGIDLVDK